MFIKEVTPNLQYWSKRLEIRQSGSIYNLKRGVNTLGHSTAKKKEKGNTNVWRDACPTHFLSLFTPIYNTSVPVTKKPVWNILFW